MPKFDLKFGQMKDNTNDLYAFSKELKIYAEQVYVIKNELDYQCNLDFQIKRMLHKNAYDVESYTKQVHDLYKSLLKIIEIYKTAETTIIESDNNNSNKISWLSGALNSNVTIGKLNASIIAEGNIFGASFEKDIKSGVIWNKDKSGEIYLDQVSLITAEISGEAHIVEGRLNGNIGYLNGSVEGIVGTISGAGAVGISVISDGMFAPQLVASAEVEAIAAQGKADAYFGSETEHVQVGAEGKLAYAEAKAELAIGIVNLEEEDGSYSAAIGVGAEVGAEAYLAEGKVSGGITIFGIEVNVGLTGKAGGVGATAGGSVTTGGVVGSLSLGVILGAEVDLEIDWSDFKFGW